MIVTEEEARGKECKRVIAEERSEFHNHYLTEQTVYCSASACMSWRWWDGEEGQPRFMLNAAGNDWIFLHYDPRRGYCGLSGTPMEE